MPRASRSFIPNQIWHINHRCHKKEFFLKFRKDRERLCELTGISDTNKLSATHASWINETLLNNKLERDEKWTSVMRNGHPAWLLVARLLLIAIKAKRVVKPVIEK